MIFHSSGETAMEQQSTEWHHWRRKGIGASESAIIAGISPYKTAYQLWEEKTGRFPDGTEIHWGITRGIELEPKARALFEVEFNLDMEPVCREHPTHSWLRASLDGWNEDERAILEIKCPGKKHHTEAQMGEIPELYMYQLAHQIAVMDAKKIFYYSFDGEKGVCIEKDAIEFKSLMAKVIKNGKKFWDGVEKDVHPEFIDRDFVDVRPLKKKNDFEKLKRTKADLINSVKAYREAESKVLEGLPTSDRIRCEGVRMIFKKDHYEFIYPTNLINKDYQPCPLMHLWNTHAKRLSKIRGMAGAREASAKARWKEFPDEEYWVNVVRKINASKFCNGDNQFGAWKADFDWFIKPVTHLKVSEGKYDDDKLKTDKFDFARIFS